MGGPLVRVARFVALVVALQSADSFLWKGLGGGRNEKQQEELAAAVQRGEALLEEQDFAGAERVIVEVLEKFGGPGKVKTCDPLVLLARARGNLGDMQSCEDLARACLKLDADDYRATLIMAKLAARFARFEESKKWYERAYELDPESEESCHGLARATAAVGHYDAAEALYSRCRQKYPSSPLIAFDLAVMSVTHGDLSGSWEQFLAAKELDSSIDLGQVGEIYASLQGEHGDGVLEYAGLALDRAVEEDPSRPDRWLLLGKIAEVQRDFQKAIRCYSMALDASQDPQVEAELHLRLGLVKTGTGISNYGALNACGLNTEEAMEHFRLALPLEGAQEALEWCEKELREAEQWAGKAADLGGRSRNISSTASHHITPKWIEELGGYKQVPRIQVDSSQQFWEEVVSKNAPVVITNFQDAFWPEESWTWRAISERFGDELVRVAVSQTGRFDGPEDGSLWGLSSDQQVLVRPPTQSMRMKDVVSLMQSDAPESFYVEYLDISQYLGEAVREMAPLPPQAAELDDLDLLLTNLWLSRGGTTAVLHYDDYGNILAQVRGTKHLTLFPPGDVHRLYYEGRRKGQLSYEFPDKFERTKLADGPPVVFSSGVDLDDPDLHKHPLFQGLHPYGLTLSPGEVLWMPEYWHHEVRSYADEKEGMNLAINFWFAALREFEEEKMILGNNEGESKNSEASSEL